jgi:uncharacterized heparinase superfamily protein
MAQSRALLYGSALYHLALSWPAPQSLALHIKARLPGDAARGAGLLAGHFSHAGETVESALPPWDAARGEDWRAWLHGFSWLADLAALGSAPAARAARDWTEDWVRRHAAYDRFAWRADVLGDRLVAWLEQFDRLDGALVASFARQARHLARVAGREGEGLARLRSARGLVVAQAALGGRRRVAESLRRLEAETRHQFWPDGGHRARSPKAQLAALVCLVEARAALEAAGEAVSDGLLHAIERAGLMVRFFRHGDGGFALFNGADEGDAALIDRVLARAEAKGRAPLTAPDTGFERLQAGGTLALFDCGEPAPEGFDRDAHAGALSFEMSHGGERIIVNCGAVDTSQGAPGGSWRLALRATAAHSTAVVADTNSAEIRADGTLRQAPGGAPQQRAEQGGDLWAAATQDGYRANFGLTHARELFLAAAGDDLRGEDMLTGTAGRGFAIRFHLHPSVDPALQPDARAVSLRLPSGARWRFAAEGAVLSLGESIYAGSGAPVPTQQILLDGHVGTHGARVRWAIRRDGRDA